MLALRSLVADLLSGPQRALKRALLVLLAAYLVSLPLQVFLARRGGLGAALVLAGFAAYGAVLLTLVVLLLTRLSAKLNDLRFMVSLGHNAAARGYELKDFFLDGAAADASLALLLMKTLALCRPRSVLELGSGQTTKILANYSREEPEASILTLEHDKAWFDWFAPRLVADGTRHAYVLAPLREHRFSPPGGGPPLVTEWYDPPEDLGRRRFDLIVVDGPNGTPRYSRCGILEFLPAVLAESFLLVFDDANRYGEETTVARTRALLEASGIEFAEWETNGLKRQCIFSSADWAFMQYQ